MLPRARRSRVPPLLTFGSWMGGDRDGNPNVTAAVTAEALDMMRHNCLHLLESRIELLAQRVSLSDRLVGRSDELADALAGLAELFPDEAARRDRAQPGGALPALLLARRRGACGRRASDEPEGYAAPPRAARRPAAGPAARCATGRASSSPPTQLHDTIRQVEVFGFHFARLDVREHAARHGAALAEIFSALGVHEAYAALAPGATGSRCSRARSPSGGR